jgi:hypothetical protein
MSEETRRPPRVSKLKSCFSDNGPDSEDLRYQRQQWERQRFHPRGGVVAYSERFGDLGAHLPARQQHADEQQDASQIGGDEQAPKKKRGSKRK